MDSNYMRLSQIAPSYSFLYRKSGNYNTSNTGDGLAAIGDNSNNNQINNNNINHFNNIQHTPDQLEQAPYYINYDGNIYDKHYKVVNTGAASDLKQSELLRSCPQPADYTNYNDYIDNLIYWKDQVITLLENSNVKLPQVTGLYYSRPMTTREIKLSKPDDAASGSKAKETADKDPWQSQLLPEEPNPENYNSYDEYKTALNRWAGLCSSRLQGMPEHADHVHRDHLLNRCSNVMQDSLPKGTKLYMKKRGT